MLRHFALVALLLLSVHSARSVQVGLTDDLYSDIDTDIDTDIDDTGSDLDVNDLSIQAPPRSERYNRILNYIKQIQKQVNDEHASLTKMFNSQQSAQINQKNRLSQAEKALATLSKSIIQANWRYGNLTEAQRTRSTERARILKSIETQRSFIKQEMNLVSSMTEEASKVKSYKEHQLIVREITELKSAIVRETNQLIARYNALISNFDAQTVSGKKLLLQSERNSRDLNTTYATMLKNYRKLQADYNSFMVQYTKNADRNTRSQADFKKEIALLQSVYDIMSKLDPQVCLDTTNKYAQLKKSHSQLLKKCGKK
jgi:chromosome segregation ATPase